ncbi:hypothetical protein E2C01_048867 [Portunus trituberculatus]|uniref:Uncharacterized protein n=1 Tax=Portunus trituberculatus TaxID=210409 RepID=A0A5B7GCP3_PORTR|nr:hypothetical protein [Portunus trituberculatus]
MAAKPEKGEVRSYDDVDREVKVNEMRDVCAVRDLLCSRRAAQTPADTPLSDFKELIHTPEP